MTREVRLLRNFQQDDSLDEQRLINSKPFRRKVDIVTVSEFGDTEERWIEVKSRQAVSATNRRPATRIPQRAFLRDEAQGSGDTISHRQYVVDRAAAVLRVEFPNNELDAKGLGRRELEDPLRFKVTSVNWNFHQFRTRSGRVNAGQAELSNLLRRNPQGSTGLYRRQIGGRLPINVGGARQLLSVLKQSGFDLASEALEDLVQEGIE